MSRVSLMGSSDWRAVEKWACHSGCPRLRLLSGFAFRDGDVDAWNALLLEFDRTDTTRSPAR